MQGASTIHSTRPLSSADLLDLWRTVYFDLPLALAGQPDSLDGERRQPPTTIGGGTGSKIRNSKIRNRPAGVEAGDPGRDEADFASEFLDGLEGCFA